MATLAEQSGLSFEQLCAKADDFRAKIGQVIKEVEVGMDAASPDAEDHHRHLRQIAFTLDDVSTAKLIPLALLNDQMGGALLDMIGFALGPEMMGSVADAASLVALYDDDIAELERKVDRERFH